MEGGFPMLNCLLQHTLRSFCLSSDTSTPSKWVYAVFWRILPRNYPPPKWDYGGTGLDRSKGNKRNWILVWEDGYCDFSECKRAGSGYIKGRFGPDVFFKMSHEVYNYGEGIVGKVAAENSHKWMFRETPNENDPNFMSSWNMSIEPQPRAWEVQFASGIQTIAVISVREGIIQLGSLDKIVEDLNLVISIQRKFSYLQSIPGVFAMQRPYLPIQHPYMLKPNAQITENQEAAFSIQDKRQVTGLKRVFDERIDDSPLKASNLGWNSPHNGITGPPVWSIPPLLPSMSCSLGALLSKLPSVVPTYTIEGFDTVVNTNNTESTVQRSKVDDRGMIREDQFDRAKVDSACHLDATTQDKKSSSINHDLQFDNGVRVTGFGTLKEQVL